jgi:hypothetical protein
MIGDIAYLLGVKYGRNESEGKILALEFELEIYKETVKLLVKKYLELASRN